jgi:hypothetical protein
MKMELPTAPAARTIYRRRVSPLCLDGGGGYAPVDLKQVYTESSLRAGVERFQLCDQLICGTI